jgi:hypothetical protein
LAPLYPLIITELVVAIISDNTELMTPQLQTLTSSMCTVADHGGITPDVPEFLEEACRLISSIAMLFFGPPVV